MRKYEPMKELKIPKPYKITIFYGVPISVNNVWDIERASKYFAFYDTIIFGAEIQDISHEFYKSSEQIIRYIKKIKSNAKIFGYLDIGVTTNNYSHQKMMEIVDDWKKLNIDGILLDNCGYINETPRSRLNAVVDFIHNKNLSVIVNSWNLDDVLADEINPIYNPSGLKSHITVGDYYLNESFVINSVAYKKNNGFQDSLDIKIKSERGIKYRETKGVQLLSIGIVEYNRFLPEQIDFYFKMHETMALIYSYDGYGITDYMYASKTATLKFPKYFEPKCDIYKINPLDEIEINNDLTHWIRKTDCHVFEVYIDNKNKNYSYKVKN